MSDEKIEGTLIHHDTLMEKAWAFQADLQGLQNEIDIAIADVQNGFFDVLKNSTSQTVNQHEIHNQNVEEVHAPVYERFNRLAEGRCRTTTQTMIDLERDVSGFAASNCINSYNRAVTSIIDELRTNFTNFTLLFSQIQQIVVKGFIIQNIYLRPQDVENKIAEIIELVNKRWEVIKPNLDALRTSLRTRVAAQNRELTNCQTEVYANVVAGYVRIEAQLAVCENFNNSKSAFNSFTEQNQELIVEEFKNYLASLPSYVWQA